MEEYLEKKGFFNGYLSLTAWKDWWYKGSDKVDPTDLTKPGATSARLNPVETISNPDFLNIFYKMERTVAAHGPQLAKKLGYVAHAHVTQQDGSIVELTIDMREAKA